MTATARGHVLLSVRDLTVDFRSERRSVRAVHGLNLDIEPGERLAIVGESGSGKTATATAMMGAIAAAGGEAHGAVNFAGVNMIDADETVLRSLRGRRIALIPQDPMNSLSPVRTIGSQLVETIRSHFSVSRAEARRRALGSLVRAGLPTPAQQLRRYPFELSGGMLQRVLIACAIASGPDILIADEATTALDVSVQAQVLSLFDQIVEETGMALIFITHDLSLVAGLAERVAVMYGGEIVEIGQISEVFGRPNHPYTKALLACRLGTQSRLDGDAFYIPGRPPDLTNERAGCPFAPRCTFADGRCATEMPRLEGAPSHQVACWERQRVALTPPAPVRATRDAQRVEIGSGSGDRSALSVNNLRVTYSRRSRGLFVRRQSARAVDDISFQIPAGRTLGLVGESGCGKSSAARAVLRLQPGSKGSIALNGEEIGQLPARQLRPIRPRMQLILQNSGNAFDPHRTVRAILDEALRSVRVRAADRPLRALDLLSAVELPDNLLDRLPGELSGGQRQRLGIARAIAGSPTVLVADEPTSALDVSLRGQILNLLSDIQRRLQVALLLISHDLSVVRYLSDDVAVMYLGRIVEIGTATEVFGDPRHPYTRALLATAMTETAEFGTRRAPIQGEIPNLFDPPSGCTFHPRCPLATGRCRDEAPTLHSVHAEHRAACHYANVEVIV